MRTFLALELNQEILSGLDMLIKSLMPQTLDVRWVRPQGIHLTLKFLGEISDAQAARVSIAMKRLAPRHGPIPFTVKGTGWFPAPSRRPRVVWVGLDSGPELPALHQDLERELSQEGFPAETRPFHPHLTVGRLKGFSRVDSLLEELERNADKEFGRMSAESLTFFESRLHSGGAVYSVLERFPFP